MIELLKSKGINVGHKFGDGPSWVMRVIRTAGDILGFDSYFLLKHSFKRNIYFVPLAKEYKAFLNGKTKQPHFYNYTKNELVDYWKERWLNKRKQNIDVINKVLEFKPEDFTI
jgi:hypothetical protein